MSKVTVARSKHDSLPVKVALFLRHQEHPVSRDLSVSEARALADALHDLCDAAEKTEAEA